MLYSLYETPRPLSVASGDEIVWCGWCYVWLHVYIIKYIHIYMHVEETAVCGAAVSFVWGYVFGVDPNMRICSALYFEVPTF